MSKCGLPLRRGTTVNASRQPLSCAHTRSAHGTRGRGNNTGRARKRASRRRSAVMWERRRTPPTVWRVLAENDVSEAHPWNPACRVRRGTSVRAPCENASRPPLSCAHTRSAARVASLLHCGTGDSPPAAAYIAFVFAQPTCSVPLAVAISAPLAAVATLLGALGSHGSADAMSRQFCRARGWLRARRSC